MSATVIEKGAFFPVVPPTVGKGGRYVSCYQELYEQALAELQKEKARADAAEKRAVTAETALKTETQAYRSMLHDMEKNCDKEHESHLQEGWKELQASLSKAA